ncbi:integrase family protein [Shewanella halifaxensis HAW-EB4]|uniref:Integrase family protein n=1 Tax=Shewanella halifaxensis (strain HAW-EB4) TaxID=458817 RepID=B0TRB4_SHEHH|nr:VPA1269 family protein [Shewanella halifaxensis]ABZ75086.1 integrase family protein [Shewanella halifaxensis HAW-EB4]
MSKYTTIEEASKAAIKLGIKRRSEYMKRYKEDPRLPSSPGEFYSDDWQAFGTWYGFLGNDIPDYYPTIGAASTAAIKLGIKRQPEYMKRYKEDPRLPSSPSKFYSDDWQAFGTWYGFLGNEIPDYYPTIEAASTAAIKLGIKSQPDYAERYKEAPRLPSNPGEFYSDDWQAFGKWYGFLGSDIPDSYPTIEAASKAAIKLGIKSQSEYMKRYKEDPRLHSCPNRLYRDDWQAFGRWYGFLGNDIPNYYPTIEAASKAAIKLGIKSRADYIKRYKEDPRLPSGPLVLYSDDWQAFGKWYGFLGNDIPDYYPTIEAASKAVIKLGIKTQPEYMKRYKEDPRLHSSPDRFYSDDWQAFGTWYGFWGQQKPYTRADISQKFNRWADLFDSFIELSQRGIVTKKRVCIGFICRFIMENNYPSKPEEFLLKTTKINKNQYEEFLKFFGEQEKSKFHVIVLEFLQYCLSQLCTLEDEDEVIIHPDFRNPLSKFQSPLLEIKPSRLSESDKPLLAYTYVVKAREWVLPPESKNLRDLNHLHDLMENDWFDVDPSLIDKSDPDCVYRYVEKDRRKGKHTGALIGAYNETVCQVWSPARFFALYTLLSVPARGQQILWCDSGEADKKVPEFVNGKVEWVANTGLLAGRAKKQGFIKEYSETEQGLHFTTNKTSYHEGGYDIPWVPENFDYWMIKLRNWQSKYNAITEPTKWTDLTLRVPIGNRILEQRGANCFLFRVGNSCQPHQQPIFSKLLAYVLHQIESKDNPLTNKVSSTGNVGSYKSDYTPHAMRVSLITAFVVDAKVPIHIVQKLVGHARLVMTIYYTKVGHAEIRDELNAANKRALAAAPLRVQQQIRNKQFEAIRDSLVPNDLLAFKNLNNDYPASAFSFTDIGICPMGGGKCEQGGEVENSEVKNKKYLPVASGHLGEKNCIRCRFFITSPAFLGGLTAVFNEISLKQFYIKQKEQNLIIHIESLEDERYDAEKKEKVFTKSMELDKAASNLELIAKETSMYATDTVHIARLIMQCSNLLNQSIEAEEDTGTMLVANTESSSIDWSIDETNSEFHQLSTVCENAAIFTLSDASLANARRSQLIDKMAHQNGIQPWLCMLSPEQQLEVGNQMSELLKSRLKSWENVEKLMRAEILLSDFNDDNQLMPLHDEVKKILLQSQANQLNINKPLLEAV